MPIRVHFTGGGSVVLKDVTMSEIRQAVGEDVYVEYTDPQVLIVVDKITHVEVEPSRQGWVQ